MKKNTRTARSRATAAAPKPKPAAPRPPAGNVLNSFLNEWGIVLIPGIAAERTEGGKLIVGATVNAAYRDQLAQNRQPPPPAPAEVTPAE